MNIINGIIKIYPKNEMSSLSPKNKLCNVVITLKLSTDDRLKVVKISFPIMKNINQNIEKLTKLILYLDTATSQHNLYITSLSTHLL